MIDYTITSAESYAEKGIPGLKLRAVVNPNTTDAELRQAVKSIQKLFGGKYQKITVWFWDRLADILIKVRGDKIVNYIQPYTLAMVEWDIGGEMVLRRRKK